VERAWEDEIIKRIEKIDSGTAVGRSWEEIKQDFDSRLMR
jgi:Putative addiction module component